MHTAQQHTPGPWLHLPSQETHGETMLVQDANGMPIAYLEGQQFPHAQANGALIAAAPDLLAALEVAVKDFRVHTHADQAILNQMRAAIAKARG